MSRLTFGELFKAMQDEIKRYEEEGYSQEDLMNNIVEFNINIQKDDKLYNQHDTHFDVIATPTLDGVIGAGYGSGKPNTEQFFIITTSGELVEWKSVEKL